MGAVVRLQDESALLHASDPDLGEPGRLKETASPLDPGQIAGDGVRDSKLGLRDHVVHLIVPRGAGWEQTLTIFTTETLRTQRRPGCGLPDCLNEVPPDFLVGGHDWEALGLALGHQQAVEGIAMVAGQAEQCENMAGLNREGLDSELCHVFRQKVGTLGKLELASLRLQHNSPEARGAQQQLIRLVFNHSRGALGQFLRLGDGPKEGVRVEKYFHPPRNCSSSVLVSGASQPGLKTICPRAEPS
jgi:hypothetical protein